MRQYNLDSHTFGKTKAAEVLVEILKQEPNATRRVGELFHSYSTGLREIWTNISRERCKFEVLSVWHNFHLNKIRNIKASDKCKSYLSNIVQTLYRRTIKGEFDESSDIS